MSLPCLAAILIAVASFAVPAVAAADTDPCQAPPVDIASASGPIVQLDDNTLWRPRNGEVLFKVLSPGKTPVQIKSVTVCFGWRKVPPKGDAATAPADQPPTDFYDARPSPLVRPVIVSSGVAYGATVPDLPSVGSSWLGRLLGHGDTATIGFDSVPLADMLVRIDQTGNPADIVTVRVPVGVTSVGFSVAIVIAAIALFFAVAWLFLRNNPKPHASLILRIISSRDHVASLSQFQIVLWTLVVGASAVYVMALSGNLIDVTDGTLTLLGIAGGAAVLGRIPPKSPPPSNSTGHPPGDVPPAAGLLAPGLAAPDPAVAGAAPAPGPKWSDLVLVGGEIDVTRIQMLVFTVITAGFVALKVIVSYEIPEIPTNFLLLMGISNGVYLTGKHIPDSIKTPSS